MCVYICGCVWVCGCVCGWGVWAGVGVGGCMDMHVCVYMYECVFMCRSVPHSPLHRPDERAGNLTVVLGQSEVCEMVRGQMKWIARTTWSNCPAHGARIVATVLNNPALYADWLVGWVWLICCLCSCPLPHPYRKECLQVMSSRMRSSRQLLYDRLRQVGCPGNWSHVLKQVGMFSYTGLTGQSTL